MLCLQETKLNEINRNLLKDTMENKLDLEIHILANGTAGGLTLGWKSSFFTAIQSQSLLCCASVVLKVIVVYGPSTPTNRQMFFQELIQAKPSDHTPWMICGDFNQTIQLSDRSNTRRQ